MEKEPNNSTRPKFLFNVDILIESESNGRALEKLLHLLNSDEIQDYIVKEGILLGKTIEIAMRESISKQKTDDAKRTPKSALKPEIKSEVKQAEAVQEANPKTKPSALSTWEDDPKDQHQEIWAQFQQFRQDNSLLRLTIVKAKGVKFNLPCRILNADASSGNVSVYHVDEKQVYLFKINEIEDFAISSK